MKFWIPYIVGAAPFFVLIGILWVRVSLRAKELKVPFTSHLLRPPGESLRRKITVLEERFYDQMVVLIVSCVWIGILCGLALAHPQIWWFGTCLGLPGVAVFAIFGIRLNRTFTETWDYRLGFMGERAVGEELNQLLANGWAVFHDVEFDENPSQKPFNVDHVVVGTGGLFAIETKARRKLVKHSKEGVVYDGQILRFPWGPEDGGIKQARERAAYLSEWISKKLKLSVSAQPVLALPGWFVERKARGDLRVVSGKEIGSLFRGEHQKSQLDAAAVNAIVGLLDQKCRDVGKE